MCFQFLITNTKNKKKIGNPIEAARRRCERPAVPHICDTRHNPAKVYEMSRSIT